SPPSIVTASLMVGSGVLPMLMVGVPVPRLKRILSPTPAPDAAQPLWLPLVFAAMIASRSEQAELVVSSATTVLTTIVAAPCAGRGEAMARRLAMAVTARRGKAARWRAMGMRTLWYIERVDVQRQNVGSVTTAFDWAVAGSFSQVDTKGRRQTARGG